MLSNVACSSPGCTNPVVGQCGGYKKSCGSFYCTVHSKDKLCTECSERKMQDDLVEEYFQLAERVEKYPASEIRRKYSLLINLFYVMLFLPICFIATAGGGLGSANSFVVAIEIAIAVSGIGLIGLVVATISAATTKNRLGREVYADAVATKPHFKEFYDIYKSERRKEMLRMAGSIAMGLIASAASEAQKSYERKRQEEMVRRAVNDELNRHGM